MLQSLLQPGGTKRHGSCRSKDNSRRNRQVVKIIAVILGGIWTYLNYVRGRTFKRRLEPKILGKISRGVRVDTWMVSGIAQAKNVGLSKVDIEASGTAIVIDDMILKEHRRREFRKW